MVEYNKLQRKISNILKLKNYNKDVIDNCKITIDLVYRILTTFSKLSYSDIINECNNAFIYYIEFIKQLKDNDNIEIQFTEVDINIFIFNKIFKGIHIK